MEKLNVAELLRNCPSGMKLDCTLVENLYFDCINDSELDDPYPIQCYTQNEAYRTSIRFNEFGHYTLIDNSKCVIFPVGKTTWEGFQRPFKEGDILYIDCTDESDDEQYEYIFILNRVYNGEVHSYCHYFMLLDSFQPRTTYLTDNKYPIRFATEEEKEKLFKVIKDNGYKWNEETKTLEELVEPNFKDGDIVFTCTSNCDWVSIFKQFSRNNCCTYVDLCMTNNDLFTATSCLCTIEEINTQRLATEEEKQKLFDAIKAKGYKWNAETKTLETLNEPNFKEGDILYCDANDDGKDKDMFKYIFIFDKIVDGKFYYAHCHLSGNKFYETKMNLVHDYPVRFATEEEKQKLFQAIKDNGYKWNSETKILEKSVKLRFKVGDKIRDIRTGQIHTVTHTFGICCKHISFQVDNCGNAISYEFQDDYELVPNKFDITTLKPFESKVLVWEDQCKKWIPAFWGSKCDSGGYITTYGWCKYCIPLDGNEHLTGTSKDCDKFYKTWRD